MERMISCSVAVVRGFLFSQFVRSQSMGIKVDLTKLEDGYTKSTAKISSKTDEDGNIIKTVTTTMTKPDGTTKTIVETTITTPSAKVNTSTESNVYQGTPDANYNKGKIDLDTFRQQALTAHNEKRAQHGIPPLVMTKELNDHAQKYAEHLIKTDTYPQHSDRMIGDRMIGENLARKKSQMGADYSGEEVTEAWYIEEKKYDYDNQVNRQFGTGHFTILIWKSSKEMGIGKAYDQSGQTCIAVANYSPGGNILGKWSANVLRPIIKDRRKYEYENEKEI